MALGYLITGAVIMLAGVLIGYGMGAVNKK